MDPGLLVGYVVSSNFSIWTLWTQMDPDLILFHFTFRFLNDFVICSKVYLGVHTLCIQNAWPQVRHCFLPSTGPTAWIWGIEAKKKKKMKNKGHLGQSPVKKRSVPFCAIHMYWAVNLVGGGCPPPLNTPLGLVVLGRKSGGKWLNNPLMESKVFCHDV